MSGTLILTLILQLQMLATTEAKSKKEILEAETLIVQPKHAGGHSKIHKNAT